MRGGRGIDSSLRCGVSGQITEFVLEVPAEATIALKADIAMAREKDLPDEGTSVNKIKEVLGTLPLLLVDDSVSILKMTKRAIQNECASITFMEAKNGEEAFEKTVEAFIGFELIITDIQMPICNGFDFTRRVRQLEKDKGLSPKIIIGISANDQQKIAEEAKESGMI